MRGSAGTVAALWRYPVKSMQGESLDRVAVGAAGLLGDRAYAVVEAETGRVASAKHPRKWGALFRCRATFARAPRAGAPLPPVVVTLPDGSRVGSDEPRVHEVLSRLLGRRVRLAPSPAWAAGDAAAGGAAIRETDRTPLDAAGDPVIRDEPIALAAPAGTWFDVAPVHLLTTATLDALAARAPESRFDVRRFRPNVVVAPTPETGAGSAFVENAWLGRTLVRRGEAPDGDGDVALSVIDPTPRCVVTTLGTGDLEPDAAVLRTIARSNTVASRTLAPGVPFSGVVGVYATVAASGSLARGDALDDGAF